MVHKPQDKSFVERRAPSADDVDHASRREMMRKRRNRKIAQARSLSRSSTRASSLASRELLRLDQTLSSSLARTTRGAEELTANSCLVSE